MNRRSILLGLTASLAAPAVVRAESLMKLWVPPKLRMVTFQQFIDNDITDGYWTPVFDWRDLTTCDWITFEYVRSSAVLQLGEHRRIGNRPSHTEPL